MTKFSTKQILEGIVSNDTHVLEFIYRSFFYSTLSFVRTHGGTKEDAFDVFQESVVIVLQRLRKGPLELECSFGTYILSIAKVVFYHQKAIERKRSSAIGYDIPITEEISALDADLIDSYIVNEKSNFVQRHFVQLSEGCQTLLRLYIERISIREIAEIMGVSESFVKKKKFECKQKLIKRIMADKGFENLFL